MATAINFNWNISKMVEGKNYDFAKDGQSYVCYRNGRAFYVANEAGRVCKDIFRDGATVLDMLALCIRDAGHLTSGEVYKAELLQWNNSTYTAENIYSGEIEGPSASYGANMPTDGGRYFYGFELEVSCRNHDCYNALQSFSSNIVRRVTDASINGYGIEFVSGALLRPSDAVTPAFYEPLCDILTGLAKSRTDASTGLHFHISRSAFGATKAEQMENIAKCIYMENYILGEDILSRIFGRVGGGRWCRNNETRSDLTAAAAKVAKYCPKALEEMKEALTNDLTPYDAIRRGHNYPSERYQRINITNAKTVEFRQGKGDINSKSIARIAQHVDTLVKYCTTTKWSKLSEAGYLRSIPSSNKYQILRDAWESLNE